MMKRLISLLLALSATLGYFAAAPNLAHGLDEQAVWFTRMGDLAHQAYHPLVAILFFGLIFAGFAVLLFHGFGDGDNRRHHH